jgi:hypothetical protein
VVPIEQACYWLAQRAPRDVRPLEDAGETEIAIIGAGLTGLWTALCLKEFAPGLGVTVVEQGLAAYGASGRNAGMLSETVDHSHGLAIEHFGEAEARRLARLGETNVADLVAFLERRQIRCDYEPSRDACSMAWGTPVTASARPGWPGESWPTWRSTGRASSSNSRWSAGSPSPIHPSRSAPGRWPT